MSKQIPSLDQWLRESKSAPGADGIGMYLSHNGVVRRSARAAVRDGAADTVPVRAMQFSYDEAAVEQAVAAARQMPGIACVRIWLNEGTLQVGDDLMLVLVGGDIRPHVVQALQELVEQIKTTCVKETELF